jgi:predicted NBD/HSP70 family sugar kinase
MTNTADRFFIGIDCVGASHVKGVVCDTTGEIVTQRRQSLTAGAPESVLQTLATLAAELKESEAGECGGVGIAVPGVVNAEAQHIELWVGFRGVSAAAMQRATAEATGVSTCVESHCNAAAYGEWTCGVARGFRHICYIEAGHDVGSAMILDGRLWRGAIGVGGAIGFNTLDIDGETTVYSRVSGDSVVRRAQERMYRDRTSSLSRRGVPRDREMILEDIIKMTAAGDELARVVIERTGMYLGIGISHVINLLNPEVVVVGGEEILAGNFLLGPALEEAERRTFPTAFKACRIVASQLSGNAGAVGAAMLARDRA